VAWSAIDSAAGEFSLPHAALTIAKAISGTANLISFLRSIVFLLLGFPWLGVSVVGEAFVT
jgi:hypothetical protein